MATGTYEYQSDFARRYYGQGKSEGRTEGRTDAIVDVLEARGVEVSDEARSRITGCTDLDQVDIWLRQAVMAGSVDELFA